MAADYTINEVIRDGFFRHTVLRNIHELDGDLFLILFVASKDDLAEAALAELSDYLIVVQNRTEIEIFP